jgi:hypothetical protein
MEMRMRKKNNYLKKINNKIKIKFIINIRMFSFVKIR